MPASSLGRRRPRPVADAPALDGAPLAKAWLVELVAIAPLEQAARLPGARFAEDAPRLCAAVSAALAADAAFDDLEPGGALTPLAAGAAELAAARAPLDAVAALEALRAVVWAAVLEALDRPAPAQVAELADRLAAVVATLTAASLEAPDPWVADHPGDRGPLAAVLRGEGETPADEPPPDEGDDAAGAEGRAHAGDEHPAGEAGRDHEPPVAPAPAPGPAEARSAPERELRDLADALRDAAGAPDPLARLREIAAPLDDPFAAAAARLRETAGPVVEDAADFHAARIAPWSAAIERRVARHRQDGLPFAVLCVEVADADRLTAADRDGDVTRALELAEAGVCAQLRPADALVRERPGRYWLTAPDTDHAEARTLAHRIATAVAQGPEHRGAPLQAAIGVATCPTDGTDTASLETRADEALYVARAAGVRVAGPLG